MDTNGVNLKIKYLGPHGNWYGFTRPFSLEINKSTRLQVRQIKTINKNILYGVSTDKTMGMVSPHNHLECKSYYAGDGRVK